MSSPNFPRRKTFLGVQAALDSSTPVKQTKTRSVNVALAALVFSLPVMAMAEEDGTITINNSSTSSLTNAAIYCVSDGSFTTDSCGDSSKDPLNPDGSGDTATKAAIVPITTGDSPSLSTSGNKVILNGWNATSGDNVIFPKNYSVAGGGSFTGGEVTGNTLTLQSTTGDSATDTALGGKAVGGVVKTGDGEGQNEGTAKQNKVIVKTKSSTGNDVIGGLAIGAKTSHSVTAEENEVEFDGEVKNKHSVYGGWAGFVAEDSEDEEEGEGNEQLGSATAKANKVTVEVDGATADLIVGGFVDVGKAFTGSANVEGNSVTISGQTTGDDDAGKLRFVRGGQIVNGENEGGDTATATAIGNSVTITGSKIGKKTEGEIIGGYIEGKGDATGNTVTITSSGEGDSLKKSEIKGNVYGNYAKGGGSATGKDEEGDEGNTITIKNSTVTGRPGKENGLPGGVVGGLVAGTAEEDGSVTKHRVVIEESEITGLVVGGAIQNPNNSGTVGGSEGAGNTVILSGGEVKKDTTEDLSAAQQGGDVIGGLSLGKGDISYNKVEINNAKVARDVGGGWAAAIKIGENSYVSEANVTNNTVTIGGSGSKITGNVFGGVSQTGDASSNTVTITGGEIGTGEITSNVRGGYVQEETANQDKNGNAENNTVLIDNSDEGGATIKIGRKVYGGEVETNSTGHASGNTVTIKKASSDEITLTIGNSVHGGATSGGGDVTNNRVTIEGGAKVTGKPSDGISGGVVGGLAAGQGGSVTGNSVVIGNEGAESDATEISGLVVGGAIMNASNSAAVGGEGVGNTVILHGGKVTKNTGDGITDSAAGGDVIGGLSLGNGAISHNKVEINGGEVARDVGGGWAGAVKIGDTESVSTADVTHNTVTIRGGEVGQNVMGGVSQKGSADENEVSISDAKITSSVYGGYAQGGIGETKASGNAKGNKITLSGSATVGEDVFAGRINKAIQDGSNEATGNTVDLEGSAKVTGNVYGGWQDDDSSSDIFTDNTLNKKSAESQIVGTVGNFATLNFSYGGNANIGKLDTAVNGPSEGAPTGVTLNIADASHDVKFNGDITGTGGLIKTGAGTLTLLKDGEEEHTYSPASTTVSAGALTIGSNVTLTSNVTVNTGAALNAYEKSNITGSLTTAENATLSFYLPPAIEAEGSILGVSGAVTLTDTIVNLYGDGSYESYEKLTKLAAGESIDLIKIGDEGSLSGTVTLGKIQIGSVFEYDFGVVDITEQSKAVKAKLADAILIPPADDDGSQRDLTWKTETGSGTWDSEETPDWDTPYAEGKVTTQFKNGDNVTFEAPTSEGAATVTVAESGVQPGKVTFTTAEDKGYTLTGGYVIGDTLTKEGEGTLTLNNDNLYKNGATINAGTLQIGDGNTTGSLDGDIVNNGALVFNPSADLVYEDKIGGAGTLTKEGAGTLTLKGVNDYSGETKVTAGTLKIDGGTLTNSAEVNVAAAAELTLRNGGVGHDVKLAESVTLTERATLNAYAGSRIGGNLIANKANLFFYIPRPVLNAKMLSAKALSAAGQPSLLPQPGKIDEALLKVGGTAYVDGSTVDIGVEGGGTTLPLKVGESVTLIEAAEIIGAPGNNTANGSKLRYGAILSPYEIGLYSENGQMWGTVLSGGNGLNAGSKALSEGFLAGSAFLNRGANFLVDRGFAAAQKAGAQSARDGKGLAGFVAIGGGRLKHDTGSHIDTEGYSVVAGLATTRSLPVGEVTLGAFIEHGEGDYNTTNSFANAARVHGKGDADYTGGGLLARLEFAGNARGHLYTEASAHAGKASLDFTARELRDVLQRSASYDSDSRYASAHAGLGYVFKLGEYSSLDLYGQYLWSRQGSDTVRLSTREEVKFRAVDSQRTRLGARWSHAVGPTGQAYVGAAWEREYDGKAKASAYGLSIAAPDMKGDTGLVEAGFTLAPNATVPLAIDVGVQGYTGKHEGVTGSFKVNYRF